MKKNFCDYTSGPYDRCLKCEYLGNGCDGPRTTSMAVERWCHWIRSLKEVRGYSNTYIAEHTGLSKTTVEKIMACSVTQDLTHSTVQILEEFLVGSAGKWPCSMELGKGKDVVYMDKPETLEMLSERGVQVERLRMINDELRASLDKEVAIIREEYQKKVDFLKSQLILLQNQIERKDRLIDKFIDQQ